MREIRTYGLKRGRWPVRLARRAGVYSTVEILADAPRLRSNPPLGPAHAPDAAPNPDPRTASLGLDLWGAQRTRFLRRMD
jgi:hypothetical protein